VFTCWRHWGEILLHPCTCAVTRTTEHSGKTKRGGQFERHAARRIASAVFVFATVSLSRARAAGSAPGLRALSFRLQAFPTSASDFRLRTSNFGPGPGSELGLGLSECSVHPSSDARARMGQYFGAVPPAGEHTVSKAFAVGRTDERSGAFFAYFLCTSKESRSPAGARPGHVAVRGADSPAPRTCGDARGKPARSERGHPTRTWPR
jgi:hypothetical protein